ncbi:MAG: transcription antitermination protein NusB [Flavobacteriaceae bacterium]|nr:transcription antitermination protein NusB [Flavobacteriaceae bacterium]
MLGRRQIREKVIQTLYSYEQNPINQGILERNMFSDLDKIQNLYVYQLNFLIALRRVAEMQIEIGKNKFIKTDENLNPNQKFIRNQVFELLEENDERRSFTSQHKNLMWDIHDDLLVKTYQRIKASKLFQDYMNNPELSFDEDQKFIGKIFLRYVAENESFHEHLSSMEISWADGFHIANSMVQKTIGFMKENTPSHTLVQAIKDDEDRAFARKLLMETLNHWEDIEKKIEERLENWDLERVALMDRIILTTAISELDNFPLTATPIIINEYVEISKVFSTGKSQIFVNGILDSYTKDSERI